METEVTREPEEVTLAKFLRKRREELGYHQREMCRMTTNNPDCGRPLSEGDGYYSRVENGRVNAERTSMDFLWAVGVILEVDPLKLFTLSRKNIPRRLVDGMERDRIFRIK